MAFRGDIEKIRVQIGGFMPVEEMVDTTIELNDSNRETITSGLIKLGVDKWEKEYEDLLVMDGENWEVVIYYCDGKKQKHIGSNMYPDTFDDFLRLLGI